ncbi:MAG: DsrE family protein [Burkholderiales bacterium]|jgi:intracellular sulfur oxidation DsrE/DsrF family protein|nr:DsrE family protein [Burkholderiales bacterium]
MLNMLKKLFICAALVFSHAAAFAQDQVIYHVTDSKVQALAGLRNARNQLDVDPSAKIIFVTHGEGVDFLMEMEGAKDRSDSPYAGAIAALAARGVKFEVCELTLRTRNLKKEQFVQEADFTPSGAVRVTRLQKQGYAYFKP